MQVDGADIEFTIQDRKSIVHRHPGSIDMMDDIDRIQRKYRSQTPGKRDLLLSGGQVALYGRSTVKKSGYRLRKSPKQCCMLWFEAIM